MTRTFLPAVACFALALGCAQPPPAELTEEDLAAIRQVFDGVAQTLSPENNEAWSRYFTQDALFMIANAPTVRGRQAILEWGEGGGSGVVLSASFSDIEIHGSGDWAWATSSYELTIEGVEAPDHGKQLVVLQRQPDGSWLTAAVHVSSDLPPPGN